MLRFLIRPAVKAGRNPSQWSHLMATNAAKQPLEPLRILFCGSDEFSCASLRAVHEEHISNKGLVESLDVMVLPPRRVGRGFKKIREGKLTPTPPENLS